MYNLRVENEAKWRCLIGVDRATTKLPNLQSFESKNAHEVWSSFENDLSLSLPGVGVSVCVCVFIFFGSGGLEGLMGLAYHFLPMEDWGIN